MENNKRTVSMNRVCLSKPVDTTNVQLDLSFYSKIKSITNNYTIKYKLNPIDNYYNMFIYFNTCKDIYELLKLFGEDFNISIKNVKERKI